MIVSKPKVTLNSKRKDTRYVLLDAKIAELEAKISEAEIENKVLNRIVEKALKRRHEASEDGPDARRPRIQIETEL